MADFKMYLTVYKIFLTKKNCIILINKENINLLINCK